jgi:hypothetical protein
MSDEPSPERTSQAGLLDALSEGNWPSEVADRIESAVDALSSRTVGPLRFVARILVYGLVSGIGAGLVLVLLALALTRLLDVDAFGHRVWASDALLSAIFLVIGTLCWKSRTSRH